ncbi:MAG: metallophosphoesterase [Terracidiphilus sp.]|nr:metallophosphoesterase [Terracidiphilus sp.]
MKAWPILAIAFIQAILFLAHWFIYHTLVAFLGNPGLASTVALRDALFLLAFSFIVAALLSFRFSNLAVTLLYKLAAVWLGFLDFFFLAAGLSWMVWYALQLSGLHPDPAHARPLIASVLFALAVVAGLYGLLNARWIRIRRIPVHLANLPASWRGRTALLASDLHLGHVNGVGFSRHVVALAASLRPDIVFLPGDLFDGTKIDPDRLVAPFNQLSPPFGIYFATGNHDEFGNAARYSAALTRAGIRVLSNEKIDADSLQILGIPYGDTTHLIQMRSILESLHPDPARASILLNHAPSRLPLVEQAGVSLQLSGHTHGGQMFPFTWLTRRVFGKFTYGLQQFGALQVYTSSGAGTWGPPMRVGTHPEIVLLQFE